METKTQKYIIRCDRAGVFFAGIAERRGDEVDLVDARKIYYWRGAAAVEQIAMDGVSDQSQLTVKVPSMTVTQAIQIIPCSEKATKVLEAIREWKL
jgi:hypothetical protein